MYNIINVKVLFLVAAAECNLWLGCAAADGAEAHRRSGDSSGVCVSVERLSAASPTQPPKESPDPPAHPRRSAGAQRQV